MDALLIEARHLLDYQKVSWSAYDSVGVPVAKVKPAPFYEWLPAALGTDIEGASEIQVVRDARLTDRLFAKNAKVREGSALDLAHLFVEAGRSVYVVSHETPDALAAIVARSGLPSGVGQLPLLGSDRRSEAVSSVLNSEITPGWLLVYELGLTPREEQRIVTLLSDRGVLVNVKSAGRTQSIEDKLIDLVCTRWV